MKFHSPKWLDLSNEQKRIAKLDFKNDYVIPGSPGTGKTVLAIQRIFNYVENNPDHGKILFLVFNKPLSLYLDSAVANDRAKFSDVEFKTYDSWLFSMYKGHPPLKSSKKFDYDWDVIMKDLHDGHCDMYDQVILDEAQDFPKELLKILQIVSKNVTSFIDVNQKITTRGTMFSSFMKLFCKTSPEILTVNYRNSKNIAEFSKVFWNGDGIFARPTTKNNITNSLIKVIQSDESNQINVVRSFIRNNLGKNIGVIVNYDKQDHVFEQLKDLAKDGARVQRHGNNVISTLTFDDKPVVHVLTYGSMKGLEYDMVIIPYFDNIKSTGNSDIDIGKMYVAVTRARDELVILYENTENRQGKCKVMDKLLSQLGNNSDIFEWSK